VSREPVRRSGTVRDAMPVPTYDRFIEPILLHLAGHPDGVPARDVHEAAASALGLSEPDRDELLPSGVQRVYKNRAGWAHDRLKRAGYSASPRRGFWQLTHAGFAFVRAHPGPLTEEVVEEIATGNDDVRLRPATDVEQVAEVQPGRSGAVVATIVASPDDRLEAAVCALRRQLSSSRRSPKSPPSSSRPSCLMSFTSSGTARVGVTLHVLEDRGTEELMA
jgi:restriction system protein